MRLAIMIFSVGVKRSSIKSSVLYGDSEEKDSKNKSSSFF